MATLSLDELQRATPTVLLEIIKRLGYANVVTDIELDRNIVRQTYVIAVAFKLRPREPRHAGWVSLEVAYEFMEDLRGRWDQGSYRMFETIATQLCREIDSAQLGLEGEDHQLFARYAPLPSNTTVFEPELFAARITRAEQPNTVAMSLRRYHRRKKCKTTVELSVSPPRPRLRLRARRGSR